MSTETAPAIPPGVEAGMYMREVHRAMREKARADALLELGEIQEAYSLTYQAVALAARQSDGLISKVTAGPDRRGAVIAAFIVGLAVVEDAILDGFNPQAAALVRQELEAIAALEEIRRGRRVEKQAPNVRMVEALDGRIYGNLSDAAHLSHHETLRSLVNMTTAEIEGAPVPVAANLLSPQHIPGATRRLFGLHVFLMLHLVDHQSVHLADLHTVELLPEAVEAANHALRILARTGIITIE